MAPSTGTVKLKQVFRMLDECAPGHSRKEQAHSWRVDFNDRRFPSFQLGKRSRGQEAEITMFHVRKLVRALEIDEDCVRRLLKQY